MTYLATSPSISGIRTNFFILVEGNLLKDGAGGVYDANASVALANYGVMHLFSNVKYELAGQEIDSVNNPGIAGVLMGIVKISLQLC